MEQLSNDGHRAFKDELYEAFARIGSALANPKRLEMLDLLAQRERSVQGLAEEMAISTANASQHLQRLREARLVETRKAGTYRYYGLADEDVFGLWRALRDLARDRLPEVDAIVERHLGHREPAGTLELEEIAEGPDGGVLLDVRPEGEYREGHLPGARSVPVDEVEGRLDELPDDEEIYVYCRGPFCTFSDEAVRLLREHGYDAHRLEPGLPDWRTMGAAVSTTEREGSA